MGSGEEGWLSATEARTGRGGCRRGQREWSLGVGVCGWWGTAKGGRDFRFGFHFSFLF